MAGPLPQSTVFKYIGGLAAVIGLIGYVVFGWRFGETEGALPGVLGIVFVIIAVAWVLYQLIVDTE